ncbi:MAG: NHLP leader peptide family RiPP precursor [Alphaproteobacteria bacterium]|nr:NHLP leader peptide family RiPP precursor [Alphaproteobacteria bacterium]MCY4230714.1 NHLP leader peptide family RiPP precursor [Alphaproteobacteria bacterium]
MNTQSQIQEQILAKADEDEQFRARLLEDPKAAIKDATGLSVPNGINVRVLEDNATDFHLVLPPAGRTLSDQEIGGVAGGGIGDIDTW